MPIQKIELPVGEGLSLGELLDALGEHKDEIKGLLLAHLEYFSGRATCDGLSLDEVVDDDGSLSLKYHFGWSAYYGCRDANDVAQNMKKFLSRMRMAWSRLNTT